MSRREDIYDICGREGCSHYRCEHDWGEVEVVYSGDNTRQVGQIMDLGAGCMNDGCKCAGFVETDKSE